MFIQQTHDLEKQLRTSNTPEDLRSKLEDVNLIIADLPNPTFYLNFCHLIGNKTSSRGFKCLLYMQVPIAP
nr:hypothetical protein [Tanacetum cinerariifolium]